MNDDELEDALGAAAALFDPVPSWLLHIVLEAYTFRTRDAELADLTFDSLADPQLVRGGDQPRLLTFGGVGITVDVEVIRTDTGYRVIGRLIPPQRAEIEIRGRPPAAVTADPLGRFTCDRVSTGPFSLRCRLEDTALITPWVII
jgi:hypothetical protein